LDNEVIVTPACHDETLCKDYENLGLTSSKSVGADSSISITDDLRLWMVSSLPNGKTFSKEHITWWQQQLISSLVDLERKLYDEEYKQLRRLLADYQFK